MASQLERLLQIERMLLDTAKAVYACAAAGEDAAQERARSTLKAASGTDREAVSSIPPAGPVTMVSLRDRALLMARLERVRAVAHRDLSVYADAKAAAETARSEMIAKDCRRKGYESILDRRRALKRKSIDAFEEGILDDLSGWNRRG